MFLLLIYFTGEDVEKKKKKKKVECMRKREKKVLLQNTPRSIKNERKEKKLIGLLSSSIETNEKR